MITVAWLRQDLRLHDQAVLRDAASRPHPVLVLHILPRHWLTPGMAGLDRLGSAKAQFLEECLAQLSRQLQSQGIHLHSVVADPPALFAALAQECAMEVVTAAAQAPEEARWLEQIRALGITVRTLETQPLFEQGPTDTARDFPATFNRFRRHVERQGASVPDPQAGVATWPQAAATPVCLDALPDARTILRMRQRASVRGYPFAGGEQQAQQRWARYLSQRQPLCDYKRTRNGIAGLQFSSRLSVDLAMGTLSARQAWHDTLAWEAQHGPSDGSQWLRMELLWREFFHWSMRIHGSRLFHYRALSGAHATHPALTARQRLYWSRWCQARTGLPCVDAPLEQLMNEGWVSNRARQLLASFLVNDMGLDWRWGAEFFQHYLVDDDVASNWGNWAYIAGVGHDAQGGRYFRVLEQTARHDPDAHHIRTWLPALAAHDTAALWALHGSNTASAQAYPAPMLALHEGMPS